MKTIYEYIMQETDMQTVLMPRGYDQLAIQCHNGRLTLWAMVDPAETRTDAEVFRIVGTGHRFEDADKCRYLSTVQMNTGLVWHVFLRVIADKEHGQ